MNFGFTEEQELLREQAQRFVEQRCTMPRVREWAASDGGFSRELFAEIAELGWTGLLIPETHGGAGLGWVEAALVLEVTGGALVPGPLASTLLAGAAIAELGSDAQKQRYLPALAAGKRIGTVALLEGDGSLDVGGVAAEAKGERGGLVATGEKGHVLDAAAADLFVVALRGGDGLLLCVLEADAEGVSTQRHPIIDRTKHLGSLRLAGAAVPAEAILCQGAEAEAAYRRLFDLGAVAITAEMVGAADAAHQLTVGYAKERTQFGRPIGQYQGVKHPLAEMFVDIATFRSLLYYAAWLAAGQPDALPRAVSMAKAYASDAFARVGIDTIQLHGAIGYTAEYDAQLYLKRSKFARPAFGDSDYHYERVAQLGGL